MLLAGGSELARVTDFDEVEAVPWVRDSFERPEVAVAAAAAKVQRGQLYLPRLAVVIDDEARYRKGVRSRRMQAVAAFPVPRWTDLVRATRHRESESTPYCSDPTFAIDVNLLELVVRSDRVSERQQSRLAVGPSYHSPHWSHSISISIVSSTGSELGVRGYYTHFCLPAGNFSADQATKYLYCLFLNRPDELDREHGGVKSAWQMAIKTLQRSKVNWIVGRGAGLCPSKKHWNQTV